MALLYNYRQKEHLAIQWFQMRRSLHLPAVMLPLRLLLVLTLGYLSNGCDSPLQDLHADLQAVYETKRGEYVGIEFDLSMDRICVWNPDAGCPMKLGNFLTQTNLRQHILDDFLNKWPSAAYLNVHILDVPSLSLDPVHALQVLNGTIIFIGPHGCLNLTFNGNLTRPVHLLVDNEKDKCNPTQPTPPNTIPPSSTNITVTAANFSDDCDFCRQHHVYAGQVVSVEFNYELHQLCVFNPESDALESLSSFILGDSNKEQHNRSIIVKSEDSISQLSVRTMNTSSWELDPAFFLRVVNKSALYISNGQTCGTMTYTDSDHYPVQFILRDDLFRCGTDLSAASSQLTPSPTSPHLMTAVLTLSSELSSKLSVVLTPSTAASTSQSVPMSSSHALLPSKPPGTKDTIATVMEPGVLTAVIAVSTVLIILVCVMLFLAVFWYTKRQHNRRPAQSPAKSGRITPRSVDSGWGGSSIDTLPPNNFTIANADVLY